MFYVYVLECSNKGLYIGYSDNLKQRIKDHIRGRVQSTRGKRPLYLVFYEAYRNKRDATKRERQLKNHKAKIDLKIQLKNSLIID